MGLLSTSISYLLLLYIKKKKKQFSLKARPDNSHDTGFSVVVRIMNDLSEREGYDH